MLKLAETLVACTPLGPTRSLASPDRRVANKYRRAHIRKLKAREYRRLRAVVPAIANRDNVTKVTVIEEAIKYIDELHQALVERIHSENEYPIGSTQGEPAARDLLVQSKAFYNSTNPQVLTERNRSSPPSWPHNGQTDTDNSHNS